ncbi:MAG: HlyD family efflux transporter periplasmic adaptor subunit [Pseudomonadota bacterium]
MIRWIEKLTARLAEDVGLDKQHHFSLPAYCDDTDEEAKTYPFTEFLWTPLRDGADIVGGYIAVKETPWQNHEDATADRFARLYAHAWRAIKGSRRSIRSRLATRKRLFIAVFALFLVGAWPVSITALAPAEVSSLDPFIVAAPFDGVVREILVDQNAKVGPDDPLIAFEDIERRNAFEIAAEEEAVALARFARASQGGINNAEAKREIAIAKAELDLARAEKEYAADLLAKTVLTAERQGLAVYSDRRDWVGRPVAAGEAIMQLADPNRIRFAIDLPVKESLVLKEGARVKIFLDSDPLRPIEAKLTEASYQAQTDKRNILAYQLSAIIVDENYAPPRIGVQGTAQIHGDKAPLAYAVLRRPLSFLRQMTGW